MTSYGIVAINIAQHSDCSIFPINRVDERLPTKVVDSISNEDFDPRLPSVRLYHQFDLAPSIGWGTRIGFPIFELDKFNKKELAHLRSCDKLFVCSKWAAQIIKSNNIYVDTHVVPLGVDSSIFYPIDYKTSKTIFFSGGKWEVRKSHNEVVEAFNRAFTTKDDVELIMSINNIFMSPQEMESKKKEYLATKMGSKIKFVGPFNNQQDLARIMNISHCGIFPSKAEGWGLETLEMMACGKEVIVTDYAGHTEYCNKDNAHLLDVIDLEPAHDNKWFFGQGNWCKFSIDQLIDKMRLVYSRGPTKNISGIYTATQFSWQNSADALQKGLPKDVDNSEI